MVANSVDTLDGIYANAADQALSLDFYRTGATPRILLNENIGVGNRQSSIYSITVGTTYYLKIVRDESVGTYGTLYCYIYSDSARTTLLDTLTLTLSTAKYDFRYLYALASYNAGTAHEHSGYVENLSISDDSEGYIEIFPDPVTDPLRRVSGIRRTFWAGIGGQAVYQVELALGGMTTTYVSPIGEREPTSAVTPKKLPSGQGATYAAYQVWLASVGVAASILIFGHVPTYAEWLEKVGAGLIQTGLLQK